MLMAELTSHQEDMSRSEAAAMLRSIADELDSGSGVVSFPVGNKDVNLSPPDTVGTEVRVNERSRRLRKDVESVAIEFEWNPTKATAESDAEEPEELNETGEPGEDTEVDR